MDDEKRQQALDNLRNALGRLEQSDFEVQYVQTDKGLAVYIIGIESVSISDNTLPKTVISNHTLRLKTPK
jgi:hypothetical protein